MVCRSTQRAAERSLQIGAGIPVAFAQWLTVTKQAQAPVVLLLSVPDQAIGAVAQQLSEHPWAPGSVALHLSGSVEVAALAPLENQGLATGSLHPLKSFVDPERDAETFPGTVFALEGAPKALSVAELMVDDCGGSPFALAPGRRPAWHAAAAHGANHLVALVDQCLDLAEHGGLNRDQARAALLPLLQGTLHNLAHHAPSQALTGPVARGDTIAVQKHLDALTALSPDVLAAYRALGQRALTLAVQGGKLPKDSENTLRDLLKDSTP
ncbi:MAG: putative short-subunit dehydrogenase-like oxidoreductase (DUF2520 family) [Pseudohongiellaceae bacterium]